LGKANYLRTVIFLKRLSFHRDHLCRHCSNSLTLGFKFAVSILLQLLVNIIPRVVALSDFQLKCFSLQKFTGVCFNLPSFKIVHLSLFSLRPEIFEFFSIVVTRV